MPEQESIGNAGEPTLATPPVETTDAAPASPEGTQTESSSASMPHAEDLWDALGQEEAKDTPAEPEKPETETPEPEAEPKEPEKPLEDQVLEDAFADKPEGSDEKKEKTQDEIDKEIDQMNPEDVDKVTRNAAARAHVARLRRFAEPMKQLKYGEISPLEALDRLAPDLGEEKVIELKQDAAHDLVDRNPDGTFQRAYVIKMRQLDPAFDYTTAKIPTLEEMIALAKAPAPEPAQPQSAEQAAELEGITAELEKTLGFDWRDPANDDRFLDNRELVLAKTVRALEAAAKTTPAGVPAEIQEKLEKFEEMEKQLAELTSTKQSAEQQEVEREFYSEMGKYRDGVQSRILPYILRNTGLEPLKTDTPEVAALKERLATRITGDEYQRANQEESLFERFAHRESSVTKELDTVGKRVAQAQYNAIMARRAKDQAALDAAMEEVKAEEATLFSLYAQATREFKAKHIDPELQLWGRFTSRRAEPLAETSQRQEVVNNGGGMSPRPSRAEAPTADDVWERIVKESAEEDRLRASA